MCTGGALGLTPAPPPVWALGLSDAQARSLCEQHPLPVGEATGESVGLMKAAGATMYRLPTVKAQEMLTKMIKALKTKECKKVYNTC